MARPLGIQNPILPPATLGQGQYRPNLQLLAPLGSQPLTVLNQTLLQKPMVSPKLETSGLLDRLRPQTRPGTLPSEHLPKRAKAQALLASKSRAQQSSRPFSHVLPTASRDLSDSDLSDSGNSHIQRLPTIPGTDTVLTHAEDESVPEQLPSNEGDYGNLAYSDSSYSSAYSDSPYRNVEQTTANVTENSAPSTVQAQSSKQGPIDRKSPDKEGNDSHIADEATVIREEALSESADVQSALQDSDQNQHVQSQRIQKRVNTATESALQQPPESNVSDAQAADSPINLPIEDISIEKIQGNPGAQDSPELIARKPLKSELVSEQLSSRQSSLPTTTSTALELAESNESEPDTIQTRQLNSVTDGTTDDTTEASEFNNSKVMVEPATETRPHQSSPTNSAQTNGPSLSPDYGREKTDLSESQSFEKQASNFDLTSSESPPESFSAESSLLESETARPKLREPQTNNIPLHAHPKSLPPRERDFRSGPLLPSGEGLGMRARKAEVVGTLKNEQETQTFSKTLEPIGILKPFEHRPLGQSLPSPSSETLSIQRTLLDNTRQFTEDELTTPPTDSLGVDIGPSTHSTGSARPSPLRNHSTGHSSGYASIKENWQNLSELASLSASTPLSNPSSSPSTRASTHAPPAAVSPATSAPSKSPSIQASYAVASPLSNNPFPDLHPIQAKREPTQAVLPAPSDTPQTETTTTPPTTTAAPPPDELASPAAIEKLANHIYQLVRQRLVVAQERQGRYTRHIG
ncbi:MAG: hypothetical protein AAFN40_03380 [Cyanobacteria bacterium J06560_6]